MNYKQYKTYIIEKITQLGANLLRDSSDIDFGLLDKSKQEEIYKFLLSEKFVCFFRNEKKMNFKKFKSSKLIDIDIDIDINTKYLKQFFYNINIKKEFEEQYFENPKLNEIGIKTLRYLMLLRGYNSNYLNFIISNKEEIEKNNFYLSYLTHNPFRKDINFDVFVKIIKRDILTIVKYLKYKYIISLIYAKIKNNFFAKRGKIIVFVGIDGSGKSTIIDILSRELGYKIVYLGDRSIKYDKFYKNRYLKPISFLFQFIEKYFRVLKLKLFTLKGKNIICDRYYLYQKKENDSFLKKKIYDFLYNKIFIKPDKVFVLWNEPEIILDRKKEVSIEEINEFNKNIIKLPFKNLIKIKNDNIDDTLNLILKEFV